MPRVLLIETDHHLASNVGEYCPTPNSLVTTVASWLNSPDKRAALSANAGKLANPTAALDLAKQLYKLV